MRKLLTVIAILISLNTWANPVDELLERIDKGASAKFKIEKVKSQNDFFELDQQGKKVVVRGNTWVNIATALSLTPCPSGDGNAGRRRSTGWRCMA